MTPTEIDFRAAPNIRMNTYVHNSNIHLKKKNFSILICSCLRKKKSVGYFFPLFFPLFFPYIINILLHVFFCDRVLLVLNDAYFFFCNRVRAVPYKRLRSIRFKHKRSIDHASFLGFPIVLNCTMTWASVDRAALRQMLPRKTNCGRHREGDTREGVQIGDVFSDPPLFLSHVRAFRSLRCPDPRFGWPVATIV